VVEGLIVFLNQIICYIAKLKQRKHTMVVLKVVIF